MKIGLVGFGKTGQTVRRVIEETDGMECVGIVSSKYLAGLDAMKNNPDVIIDFSHPSNLEMIKTYTEVNRIPLVLGTTGYGTAEYEVVKGLAEIVPVVYTANFSLGINIFQQILKQITPVMRDTFDIEMIEKHHRTKLDAPSGTAKMLLASMENEKEIRVHSIRSGSIPGEHTVMFAGEDEIFEITHRAGSNRIFAGGAILAAKFTVGQQPGLYDMNDVLFGNAKWKSA